MFVTIIRVIINKQRYSNLSFIRGKQEANSRRETWREEVKRESHHELQCSSIPESFSDSHRIHIDQCYKKYLWNYFSWVVFKYFQVYACLKFVAFLFQRSSCSQVLAFLLNACIPACNSPKQLLTAYFKKTIFFQNLILELSHETVLVKGLQVQSSLKINSFTGMCLKFGD